MKIIKFNESNIEKFNINVDDYVIWRDDNTYYIPKHLEILRIIESEGDSFRSNQLYIYNGEKLKRMNNKEEHWNYPTKMGEFVIFVSNDLETCKNAIKVIDKIDNYNL